MMLTPTQAMRQALDRWPVSVPLKEVSWQSSRHGAIPYAKADRKLTPAEKVVVISCGWVADHGGWWALSTLKAES